MSYKIVDIVVICPTTASTCEMCGVDAETRPYGPRGENICFKCGMENKETTVRQATRILLGEDVQ